MTDEQSFLAAIGAQPREDLPRLAYADWLDERSGPGDPERARLIRLQIQRYRLHETAPLPRIEGRINTWPHQYPNKGCVYVAAFGKPPDDMFIGRLYEFWEVDERGPRWRPQVLKFVGGYREDDLLGNWVGTFKEDRRPDAVTLAREEDDICRLCPEWAYEDGKPKCLGWKWAKSLGLLNSPSWSDSSWTPGVYERGFPVRAKLVPGDAWVRQADTVLAQLPLEEVELETWPQVKRKRQTSGIYGYENELVVWLGDRVRLDPEVVGGRAPIDLLRYYWPQIRFTIAK